MPKTDASLEPRTKSAAEREAKARQWDQDLAEWARAVKEAEASRGKAKAAADAERRRLEEKELRGRKLATPHRPTSRPEPQPEPMWAPEDLEAHRAWKEGKGRTPTKSIPKDRRPEPEPVEETRERTAQERAQRENRGRQTVTYKGA